jgi:hypothetical protein
MNKTGSSSIQRSLNQFANDQFVYARLGEKRNHSLPIYSLFASRPQEHYQHRSASADEIRAHNETIARDLDNAVATAGERTLIISGESISTLPAEDVPSLRDYFDQKFAEVVIVGYVRPPAGFLASAFQQGVKNGRTTKFDPGRLYRSYRELFEKFDRVFGRERVHLRKFDPAKFPNGCVVQDFCALIGLRFPERSIRRINDSLSRDAVAALYTYVKFGAPYGSETLRGPEGVRLGSTFKSGKFRFAPDIVRPVLERNAADIEWMEERLGQSLRDALDGPEPTDVRSEADLITPDSNIVAKLLAELGTAAPADVTGKTPQEVAQLVHALRQVLAAKNPVNARRRPRDQLN